jgi:hypothetical protein
MNDHHAGNAMTPTQIAIQDIIQIRVMLGNEEQVPTTATTDILVKLDSVILDFVNGLNSHKGN